VKGTEVAYGLGVFLNEVGKRELFGHSGGYPGHITRTLACPDSGLVVALLGNAIDAAAESLAMAFFRLLDLSAAATHRCAPAPQAGRFTGRFCWLWGVRDVARLDGRLYALDPSAVNPAEDAAPLEVIDSSTLKIVGGRGGGSVGELMHYDFAADGSIRSVRGESGMTMTPFQPPD
jgi:hypothetical protein